MLQTIEAVYEYGLLRPLSPLTLMENCKVQIIISDNEQLTKLLTQPSKPSSISKTERKKTRRYFSQ